MCVSVTVCVCVCVCVYIVHAYYYVVISEVRFLQLPFQSQLIKEILIVHALCSHSLITD